MAVDAEGRRPRYASLVEALPAVVPFVPPEALERRVGRPLRVRIGANESAFGPSPKAVAAMAAEAARVNWYGDPEGFELRSALARRHGVSIDNVVLGGGVDELLGLVVRAFIDPGDVVTMSHGGYPTFAFHVNGFGGRFATAPYRDDRNDPEALADAARRAGARLVYLSNPDNPSGSWLPAAAQRELIERLPPGVVLALDEAYADFAPADSIPEIDPEDSRVIRLRTFSKAFGLAGLRVGYAIAPAETIRAFDKIRNHFAVGRLAQAGALASLGDPEFIAGVVREVAEGRREYQRLADELGLKALPSATNFVSIDVGSAERAKAVLATLLEEHGVFIRMPGLPPLNRCVRVTIGTASDRAAFAEAFRQVLKRV
ncbi:MAG TPA: aminotransferase class I/II-fold pyridoxal phosphate-dependent enzyme [Stellaceae bacterium]